MHTHVSLHVCIHAYHIRTTSINDDCVLTCAHLPYTDEMHKLFFVICNSWLCPVLCCMHDLEETCDSAGSGSQYQCTTPSPWTAKQPRQMIDAFRHLKTRVILSASSTVISLLYA